MAYELENRISALLDEALKANDISSELEALQIPKSACETELLGNSSEVLLPGRSLLEAYAQLETRMQRARPTLTSLLKSRFFVYAILVADLLFGFWAYTKVTGNNILSEPYKSYYQNYFLYIVGILIVIVTIAGVRVFIDQQGEYKDLRISLTTQAELIDLEILENGIKPALRLFINRQKRTSLETTLVNKNAPGLWSIMDTAFEVPTPIKSKVERLIANLSGGSIGIAGPRGVGKSTLLNSICDPNRKEFQELKILTVMTSVPVKYDSKDFVLHLYSEVCEKLLKLEIGGDSIVFPSARKLATARILSGIRDIIFEFREILFLALITGLLGMTFSAFQAMSFIQKLVFLDRLEISIGEIFSASAKIFAIAFLFSLLFVISTGKVRRFQIRKRGEKDELTRLLVLEAGKRLDSIKFQMSYSEGWSGGIKLPENIQMFESSSEYSYTKSRNQLTLPEIISDYRNFIQMVSQKYKVLIGIDELDKITSSDIAQQFLNETKAIFGMRNCFYLVSVSDNALSNFERRGIAFRDEFDTSFDDVLFLETPNFDYDLDLLQRRVIGMPLPFAYYCYTLSGGLPRDLIRVCRDVFDIADRRPVASLEDVVIESTGVDLRSKIRAVSIAASECLVEPEASLLFSSISKIALNSQTADNWLEISEGLIAATSKPNFIPASANKNKMIKLIEELASYLLFSFTIKQYFCQMSSKQTITELSKPEITSIESLARAKQLVTSSPAYSRSVIMDFRQWAKLDMTTETNNASNGSKKQKARARKPADKTV